MHCIKLCCVSQIYILLVLFHRFRRFVEAACDRTTVNQESGAGDKLSSTAHQKLPTPFKALHRVLRHITPIIRPCSKTEFSLYLPVKKPFAVGENST